MMDLLIGQCNKDSIHAYPILPSPKTVKHVTVRVRVEGQNSTIFNGEVSFSNSTIVDTNGKTHNLDKPTPLGALAQASKSGNFQYEVKDYSWSLYVKSINCETEKGASGWIYLIANEDSMPMISADTYPLKDGDNILWSYGGLNSKPFYPLTFKHS